MVKICEVCGKPAECTHHLIFGSGYRGLSDEDDLVMSMCNDCHNMASGTSSIHGNSMAESLSKMLGQALWERDRMPRYGNVEKARKAFMARYGRSWL